MKQHRQHLQKTGGILRLLIINVTLLLCIGCNINKEEHQSQCILEKDSIECIYIFCMDLETFFPIDMSKEDFLSRYVNTNKTHHAIISNRLEIEHFISIVNTLKKSSDYSTYSHNIRTPFFYKPFISKSNQLYLQNTYPLDIKGLVLLTNHNNYTPIWVSNNYVDINNVYYETSEEIRAWIEMIINN